MLGRRRLPAVKQTKQPPMWMNEARIVPITGASVAGDQKFAAGKEQAAEVRCVMVGVASRNRTCI